LFIKDLKLMRIRGRGADKLHREIVGGEEQPKVVSIKWEESREVVAAGQSAQNSMEMVRGLSKELLGVELPADE
jgi:hypothetical protein